MKKITYYYVRKNDPLVWLSAALMLASAVCRVAFYRLAPLGVRGFWLYLLLPLSANLSFPPILLYHGERRLYKTFVPVLLGCLFFSIQAFELPSAFFIWLCLMLYIAIAVLWLLTVDGRLRTQFLLLPLFGASFLFHLIVVDLPAYWAGQKGLSIWLPKLSVLLILASLLCASGAMRKRPRTGEYFPRRGDRNDGRLVHSISPMAGVTPYIMVNRIGASNFIFDKVECSTMEEYIRKKRREGLEHFGTTHVFLAAYVRAVAKLPALNRFLSGQRIYSRDENIEVSMVVKKEMNVYSPDTVITVYLSPWDTADDVYRKLDEQVERAKNTPLDSSFDHLAGAFNAIPGLFLKFAVWMIKTLDYFGKLPRVLTKLSPFHGSLFITSMGSLGIPPICHHLYDFGNIPAFCAFGKRRRENEVTSDGTVVRRKYIDFSFNTDERICDGFYLASALKEIRKNLANPYPLDQPPEKVLRDVD